MEDKEGRSGLDAAQILDLLRQEPELIPDEHDGSYELMRQTIEAYSQVEDYAVLDYTDLDLIYLMAIITTRDSAENKKKRVMDNLHLNDVQKSIIVDTINRISDKAIRKEYTNVPDTSMKNDNDPYFGMFGTGFRTFGKIASNASPNWKTQIQNLIKTFVDIRNKEDDEEIFDIVQQVVKYPIKGIQAGSISIMLHCLKPNTFPIINGNEKMGDIFSELGISLKQKHLSETYISNCRNIKHFRDTYLSIKNYRVFDLLTRRLNKNIELYPPLDRYDGVLSKSQWKEFLAEDRKTHPTTFIMLKTMLEMGGEASPLQIAEKLGQQSAAPFISRGKSLGDRVKKKYNISDYYELNGDSYSFIVPFRGHGIEANGKKLYSWVLRQELKEALIELLNEGKENIMSGSVPIISHNTILYGPPGTGKTYNTVIYAVAIIEKKELKEVELEAQGNYDAVKMRFDSYRKKGRIAFTTFHQSYGYEEFIEGIRPVLNDVQNEESNVKQIEYEIHDGIFKELCVTASRPVVVEREDEFGLNRNPVVWKVSLEGTGDNETRRECLDNDHIRIGWDEYGAEINEKTDYVNGTQGKAILNAFINQMRIGDVVLSCYSKSETDAIGIIVGDYEWNEKYSYYKRVRKVKWLVKDIRENILRINNGASFTLSTVYKMKVSLSDVMDIVKKYSSSEIAEQNENYVLVVDEINRGNISKIFGELITLIEETKRIGKNEEVRVRLPYSGMEFGVPSNVYIIGTMNTADRSIAIMDTALRRRFDFVEMMPDPKVVEDITIEKDSNILNISEMLKTINTRIEYLYDREHTIGHGFFTKLKDENATVEKLADIFKNKIIPLLQEYFYEDYEKIQLVLGDNEKSDPKYKFIMDDKVKINEIFKGRPDLDLKEKSFSISEDAFEHIQSYIEITHTRKAVNTSEETN